MAKYTVTYACGHTGTVELYGKYDRREETREWLKTQDCPDCKRAAELAAAKQQAEKESLPELEGSEKQINWAMSLRAKAMRDVRAHYPDIADEFVAKMLTKTQAKWWIDHRYYNVIDEYGFLRSLSE